MDGVSNFESQIPESSSGVVESAYEATQSSERPISPSRKLIREQVTITNKMGLHARPAMQFVDLANKFASKVTVCKGSQCVNGKSIMEMMLLAAGQGTNLTLIVDGPDADKAVKGLKKLIDEKFDED